MRDELKQLVDVIPEDNKGGPILLATRVRYLLAIGLQAKHLSHEASRNKLKTAGGEQHPIIRIQQPAMRTPESNQR